MHEYPITQRIIEIAEETANKNNASKVTEINVVMGSLMGYSSDSIAFYFEIMSEGTIVEGAKLNIRQQNPEYVCSSCGHAVKQDAQAQTQTQGAGQTQVVSGIELGVGRSRAPLLCELCGANLVENGAGRAFYLESIEVENNAD